jgi:zinc and cadmium transporter
MLLLTIVTATIICSVVSLLGALLLALKSNWSKPFALHLTALSSGVLLTTALLHLAPEAVHDSTSVQAAFVSIFVGIVGFFLLERLVLWYHHHHDSHHPQPSAWLITIGDSVHNFIDGVAIAAAFIIDPGLGLVTAIAIGAHEIPQEIADFAILINSGMSRSKALILNILSAFTALAGALAMYLAQPLVESYVPSIIGFSAGMFLYIALADLIPELHHRTVKQRDKWIQLVWFVVGIILLFGVTQALGDSHGHLEDDDHLVEIEVEAPPESSHSEED